MSHNTISGNSPKIGAREYWREKWSHVYFRMPRVLPDRKQRSRRDRWESEFVNRRKCGQFSSFRAGRTPRCSLHRPSGMGGDAPVTDMCRT